MAEVIPKSFTPAIMQKLLRAGLAGIRDLSPAWFTGIRQDGLVMGLEFAHPRGAQFVMKRLYEAGVWAIFSTLDPRVLQYKPGVLMPPGLCFLQYSRR